MDNSQFWTQADVWLDGLPDKLSALWAKSGDGESFLPLPQHLLDSACVAVELWDHVVSPSLKAMLAEATGLTEAEVKSLYVFLAGVHDIGKAIPQFITCIQDKKPYAYLVDLAISAGFDMTVRTLGAQSTSKIYHNTASGIILKKLLTGIGVPTQTARSLAEVVDAHHGQPTEVTTVRAAEPVIRHLDKEWGEAHQQLFDAMLDLSQVSGALQALTAQDKVLFASTTQILTGLVIMADWIASNELAFPYSEFQTQGQRSIEGLLAVDLTETWEPRPLPEDPDASYRADFAWPENFAVRPVQKTVYCVTKDIQSPSLMIIEAPTGEGKTEAALMAAHLLGMNSAAQGIFFAAPTQATANGLLGRVIDWSERATKRGAVISLFLAHSKRDLNKEYSHLRFKQISEDSGDHGDVIASQWMSGSKKGVLSNFVVGTIDQVLLLALKMRHSMLRHVGLAGKTIVIDEAHAYDVYMQEYLHTALEWLARYGANVIILSATLPPVQRQRLIGAFASQIPGVGREIAQSPKLDTPAYPLISVVNAEGLTVVPVEPRPTESTMEIKRLSDDEKSLHAVFRAALSEGGIALVICNTIQRAQETAQLLEQDYPDEVVLFHSGFIATHRARREGELLAALGPRSHRGAGRPDRLIVVATQVVEQSLDIDVDLLITDIAPMDLLIQRIGRLHRHRRPVSDRPVAVHEPKVYVRGVEQWEPVPQFESGTKAIYGSKILLATVASLPRKFCRPDDIAPLVHLVYSDNPTLPTGWEEEWARACDENQAKVDRARSRSKTYRIPSPAVGDTLNCLYGQDLIQLPSGSDEEAGHAQVRDTEPSVEVIVIQETEYGYLPFGAGAERTYSDATELSYAEAITLAANSLRLPLRMTRCPDDFREIIYKLESDTPSTWRKHSLLRGSVALRLDREGKAILGKFSLRYENELGLVVERCSPEHSTDRPSPGPSQDDCPNQEGKGEIYEFQSA